MTIASRRLPLQQQKRAVGRQEAVAATRPALVHLDQAVVGQHVVLLHPDRLLESLGGFVAVVRRMKRSADKDERSVVVAVAFQNRLTDNKTTFTLLLLDKVRNTERL